MLSESTRNRYVVIPPWSNEQINWNPFDSSDLPLPDCAYLGAVLMAMEHNYDVCGLQFYITTNLDRLPTYGDDVVAIVISDEWCRIPRYAFKVRAIFKTYGTRLPIHWGAFIRPTVYDVAALAQDLRTCLRGLPYVLEAAITYMRAFVRGRFPAWPIYEIPLGYYRQTTLPMIAIHDRRFDVYFAGSVTNRGSVTDALNRFTPKFLSRARMLSELRKLSAHRPDLSIDTGLTPSFMQTSTNEAEHYTQMMMQTRICLVPRGTSLETYRYFEGLRFGCVLITERLPRRWFYDHSPALRLNAWADLNNLVPALLADPQRMERLSRASIAWWNSHCSEDRIARFLGERLMRKTEK